MIPTYIRLFNYIVDKKPEYPFTIIYEDKMSPTSFYLGLNILLKAGLIKTTRDGVGHRLIYVEKNKKVRETFKRLAGVL